MGVDFGLKRVGISVSDKKAAIAVGVRAIEGLSGRSLARAVAAEARTRSIDTIVVGQPPEGFRDSELVIQGSDKLVAALKKMNFNVFRWDESYTTATVLSSQKQTGGKVTRKKCWTDEAAAVLILQGFLDSNHIIKEP